MGRNFNYVVPPKFNQKLQLIISKTVGFLILRFSLTQSHVSLYFFRSSTQKRSMIRVFGKLPANVFLSNKKQWNQRCLFHRFSLFMKNSMVLLLVQDKKSIYFFSALIEVTRLCRFINSRNVKYVCDYLQTFPLLQLKIVFVP